MQPMAVRYKEFHTFPKAISLKVIVIARLAFEIAYYTVVVPHFSHYAKETFFLFKERRQHYNI